MGFDGSSITGFNAIEESDMIAMPDAVDVRGAALAARRSRGVARMFCDIVTPEPRALRGRPAPRAAPRARARGGDGLRRTSTSAPSSSTSTSATPRSRAAQPEVLDEGGYFDLTTLDAGSDVRRETVLALEQLGIHVEYTHHEVGPSQHEIDMRYADALKMADDCMTYRITVKEYAMKYGWHATFMPKPLFGENGSGMHTHQSLFKDGRNAFYDANDQYFLSDVGKAFIAGQLKHAREICSIFAQWVNSYKRLVPGLRGAGLLRVVAPQPLGARARAALPPGQGAGHAHGAALPGPGVQPVPDLRDRCCRPGSRASRRATSCPSRWRRTSTTCRPEERKRLGIEQLPETLGEAIELTAESELVLRTLGEHMFNRYVEIKRQEWEDYRVQVTQWELDRYLSVL